MPVKSEILARKDTSMLVIVWISSRVSTPSLPLPPIFAGFSSQFRKFSSGKLPGLMATATVSVKFCCADDPSEFFAVNFKGYVPSVPAAGAPLRTPVSLLKLTPDGKAPTMSKEVAKLSTVTVKLPIVPSINLTLLAELMAGADDSVFCGSNTKLEPFQEKV